ncbi:hypothetical protein JXO52_04205 [bacterium]|nr:hypothetical protein [bacterium]
MKRNEPALMIKTALLLLFAAAAAASDGVGIDAARIREDAPKVYLDGRDIDENYIKTEIPFVNYVRDPQDADIHLLITTQKTGSGGREYTMNFIGRNTFNELQNTIRYCSGSTDTIYEVRDGVVRTIKLGLAPYMAASSLAGSISVRFREQITYQHDSGGKWNHWIFHTSVRSSFDGQKTSNSASLSGSVTAERVTLESRTRIRFDGRYKENQYDFDDYVYTSTSERANVNALWVKSLGDHWSAGGWISAATSSYSNIDYTLQPQPAIEYNVFPYAESTRRQLRLLYKAGFEAVRYRERTIYDKRKESLFSESLAATLELTEQWGNARFTLEGSHYFHDFSKNKLTFFGELSLRVFRGFSFDISGHYSATHNQLNLPKGEVSTEDLLLRRKEMASDYSYFFSVGFGYRFGALFNNVVNPRFGASSSSRYD